MEAGRAAEEVRGAGAREHQAVELRRGVREVRRGAAQRGPPAGRRGIEQRGRVAACGADVVAGRVGDEAQALSESEAHTRVRAWTRIEAGSESDRPRIR